MEDVAASPGWTVALQRPAPTWIDRLRGRTRPSPAAYAVVHLVDGPGEDATRWEAEINRLPDGTWELATNMVGPGAPTAPVSTPGGTVALDLAVERLVVRRAEPAGGWAVEQSVVEEDDEALVRFTRGDELWEVVVVVAPELPGGALVEVEHNWRLPATG